MKGGGLSDTEQFIIFILQQINIGKEETNHEKV